MTKKKSLEATMNRYEKHLNTKGINQIDIIKKRLPTCNPDTLHTPGYERDIFGNLWRKGSGNPFINTHN